MSDRLESNLTEQIDFLKDFNALFDNGDTKYFKKISNTIRNIREVLAHLGHLDKIEMLDSTTPKFDGNLLDQNSYNGLVCIAAGGGPTSFFILGTNSPYKKYVSFEERSNTVVVETVQGDSFTRNDLIRTVRDKEGGSHIDKRSKSDYDRTMNEHVTEWAALDGSIIEGLIPYSIRQMSLEILHSIQKYDKNFVN